MFDALCQHHLYDHRVWCYHPSHPWWDSILKQRAYKLKLKYYIWRRLTINILGGRLMTILMIVTLIPFFLHCLCTSASNINTIIDRFSPSTSQQDRLLVNLSELWASQTTMVTLKIWLQKNMTSMQSCARKPFGKWVFAQNIGKWQIFQGTLVLVGVVIVHLFISSIYHLVTTGWSYGDV